MPLTNTSSSYGLAARTLHWLTALLIFVAFPLGYVANTTPLTDETAIARVFTLFSLHKTVGIMALLLGVLRVAWTSTQERPAPVSHSRLERAVAEITHWTLTIALIAVPLSGWLAHSSSPGLAPIRWPFGQSLPFVPTTSDAAAIFGAVHWLATKVLGFAILLHVAGALKHVIVDRDATFARMIRGTSAGQGSHPRAGGAFLVAATIWIAALGLGALGAPKPPSPPVPWSATDVRVELWSVQTGKSIGDIPAADVTLTLGDLDTGTVEIFAALDSVSSPEADPLLAALPIPIAQFTGTLSGTAPELKAIGQLDVGGQRSDAALTVIREGDTARLQGDLVISAAPDFSIRIETGFVRPAE